MNATNQKLQMTALQQAMSARVGLLLGAGASVCFGRQTAVGFLDNLEGEIGDNIDVDGSNLLPPSWIYELRASVARYENTTAVWEVDLESVLDYLTDLTRFGKAIRALGEPFRLAYLASSTPLLDQMTGAVLSAVHRTIRQHYSQIPSDSPTGERPQDVYLPLLSQLQDECGSPAPVFTTNYDLAVEQAFSGGDWDLLDGFWNGSTTSREWSLRNFDSADTVDVGRTTCLFKLHGSCNWYYESDRRVLQLHRYDTAVGDLAATVIYPQARKIEQVRGHPFGEMYDILERWIDSSERGDRKLLVVVGFSFRDSQITDLIRKAVMREKLKILWVDPSATLEKLTSRFGFHVGYSGRAWPAQFGAVTIPGLLDQIRHEHASL